MFPDLLKDQKFLADYYRTVTGDPATLTNCSAQLELLRNEARTIKDNWTSALERNVNLSKLPENKGTFLNWYMAQEKGINDDIQEFINFIAKEATIEQIAYYICMEEMIDGSFDDLMAMSQVGMPIQCKMAAAENYWDEMGNGNVEHVHTSMFKTSSAHMRKILKRKDISVDLPPAECYMNGNLLLMWALRREFNVRLIGAMGLIEGSAPIRFSATTAGLERLHQPTEVIAYHKAHIGIDTNHSREWLERVLTTYSDVKPCVTRELALGVSIRHQIALQYYRQLLLILRDI